MNSTDIPSHGVLSDPTVLNLTHRQATVVLPSLLTFLEKHPTKIGEILNGGPGKWSAKDLRELESVVLQDATSSARAADYLRVLRKACAFWAGREQQNVGYPRIPTHLAHPPNPFRSNFAKLLRTYDSWKEVLDHWLDAMDEAGSEPNESAAGLAIDVLVLSSILYGGLHTRTSVAAMLRALADAQNRTLCVDGRMHIELSLSWHGMQDVEFRRWQPDALTATMWATMPEGAIRVLLDPGIEQVQLSLLTDVELGRKVKGRIDARLPESSALENVPRGGLDRLLQAASLAAYTEIPAILAAYARRKIISHSLKRRAFERLTSGGKKPSRDAAATIQAVNELNVADPRILETPRDLEPEWLQAVRSALSAATGPEVKDAMNQLAASTSGPCFMGRLADFLDWLLIVRTGSGKTRTLSSVKRTVMELARSMGPLLEVPDPLDLDSDLREELYSKMIESTGSLPSEADNSRIHKVPAVSKRRRNLSSALYEFERYLNSKGKERVEDESVFCGRFGLSAVDANIVTFEEYDAALKEVDTVWPPHEHPERNRIAKFLLCLGFRAGLRRREALFCLTSDIGPAPDYEFIVRPSEYRGLKSRSARRRIPLRHILPSGEERNELGLVLDWQKQRRSDPDASPLLLGMKDGPQVVPETIIEDLNKILRKVTGDDGIHYHHLRHSQAGWNWLRLTIADQPRSDLFPHLEQTSEWLREGPEFRKQLYGHAGPTRKHAYFAAQQLGHLSPSTSMQTYIHFADYALALSLSRSSRMCPSEDQILKARGKSRQTAERKGFDEANPLALAVALWNNRCPKNDHDQQTADDAPEANTNWTRCVYEFLHDIELGESIEKSAEQHHLDSASADKIYRGMAGLGYLQSKEGRWVRKKGYGKTEFLRWPTDPYDLAVIRHFEVKLAEVAEADADATAAALRCHQELIWDRKPMVVFREPTETEGKRAYAFVRFLKLLEINRKKIRWFSFSRRSRSTDLATWKRYVKYNPNDNKIENISGQGREEWFGIMPRLDEWAGVKRSNNPGAFGFRFLMRMAYLRWR